MSVMRSRLRAHAIEWHVAPAAHIDARHRAGFLELQRRCNNELCRHAALTRNLWLDRLESALPAETALLATLTQLAIFLRQLALAREHHALLLTEHQTLLDGDGGAAVAICFDESGVPWCPPLPGMGIGDPYILSDRLHDWWLAWQRAFPALAGQDWSLHQGSPATRALCALIERDYNAADLGTALGVLVAVENSISTDLWQRLGKALRECCSLLGVALPDAGFLPVAETHARLQARHGLYLVEAASVNDLLDEKAFFQAGINAMERLSDFWKEGGDALRARH